MTSPYSEVELPNTPLRLCSANGNLNPDSVGWTRHPVHDCSMVGHWPRKKRWNYWCITSGSHLFSITISNVDYAGLVFAYLLDFETKQYCEKTVTIPFARGVRMSDGVLGACAYSGSGVDVTFDATTAETTLRVNWKNFGDEELAANIKISYPKDYETMSVVIPWSPSRFQYTSKHHGMTADGTVDLSGGRRIEFRPDTSFACLDFGRGIWPYSSSWNWGGGSGRCDGRLVGLNLGARWTDGTGLNENGVVVDGCLRKVHDDLRFEYDSNNFLKPWSIRTKTTNEVDLTFTPFYERIATSNLLILRSEVHQLIGHYTGTVKDAEGNDVRVEKLVGWAEEHVARW